MTIAQTECVHHWMVESPSGSKYSSGTCKHCGTTRSDFNNSIEYSVWYGFNKTRPNSNTNKTHKRRKDNKGRFVPGKGKLS